MCFPLREVPLAFVVVVAEGSESRKAENMDLRLGRIFFNRRAHDLVTFKLKMCYLEIICNYILREEVDKSKHSSIPFAALYEIYFK